MAATAQNHMEPLHGDEKKHDEYEYEDECTCDRIKCLGSPGTIITLDDEP
jgi:hypothetical protein